MFGGGVTHREFLGELCVLNRVLPVFGVTNVERAHVVTGQHTGDVLPRPIYAAWTGEICASDARNHPDDEQTPSRDFHFACHGWTRYTPESRRARGIFFIAQSSRF